MLYDVFLHPTQGGGGRKDAPVTVLQAMVMRWHRGTVAAKHSRNTAEFRIGASRERRDSEGVPLGVKTVKFQPKKTLKIKRTEKQ